MKENVMRTIPSTLQAKLDSGVTTLCRCWIMRRLDGVTLGFTDHDEDVLLGQVRCQAGSGLSGSEVAQKLGLAVDSSEISGAVTADMLSEADLAAGHYDAAVVEQWLVDWTEPDLRVLLAKGTLGEIRREGAAFTAEMRGLSEQLSQDSGRLYTVTCSADLGDARCKFDVAAPGFHGAGAVAALDATSSFTVSGLDDFDAGWFIAGKLAFTSGANSGLGVEVKAHRKNGTVSLALWQAMPEAIAVGDTFTVTVGCDKRFQTCRDRFDNVVNFRGFPHIPGNDFVISYPVQGQPGNDGRSRQS
jgi:uncharacterized phage protein (TIGR02218 family)